MRILLNILWIILGGLLSTLGWILTGCLWCITIIGGAEAIRPGHVCLARQRKMPETAYSTK